MTPNQVGLALVLLGVMVLLGKTMRIKWGWTQKLFLPASILAGFLALFLGPEVFGSIASAAQ